MRREDPCPFFSPTPGRGPELRVPIKGRPGIQRPGSCPAHLVPGGERPGSPPSLLSGLLLSTCLAFGMPLPRVLRHTSCLLSRPRFPVSSQVPCLTPGSRSRPRSPILPQVPVSSQVPCHTPGPLSRPRSPVSSQVPYLAPGPCLVPGPLSHPTSPVSPHLPCLAPGPCLAPSPQFAPGPLSHPMSPVLPQGLAWALLLEGQEYSPRRHRRLAHCCLLPAASALRLPLLSSHMFV